MSAGETVTVTQADREQALKAAGFDNEGDLQYWGNSANRAEVAALEQAFARHRTQSEAASKEREAALVEALELGLEYWAHRQQRYKNRRPVWVGKAKAALAARAKATAAAGGEA